MDSHWLVTVLGVGLALLALLLVLALVQLNALRGRLDIIGGQGDRVEAALRAELGQVRSEAALTAQATREELGASLSRLTQSNDQRLEAVRSTIEQRLEVVRSMVEQRLDALRADNAEKLEQMRATVDEKLHATLEQRLGESFKLVSQRLEQVHKGLGEMQTLATGVGDLKKVLTNIKTRGTWGEQQLESLLVEMLTPAQYEKNVATRPNRGERVEFAIRLPGRDSGSAPVWLPIDAKFPLEDFQRLQDAQERGDAPGVELFGKALEDRIRKQARDIRLKYVEAPHTTDFALLYLPLESLYAEVLRRPGLASLIQRESQVTLAGPATLAALLNSLQMGFRTLAIEQRSAEVWRLLGAVKTEFGTFGDLLAKTKKQLDMVGNTLENAEVRTRAIERKLRGVEALPEGDAARLLSDDKGAVIDIDPELDLQPSEPAQDRG